MPALLAIQHWFEDSSELAVGGERSPFLRVAGVRPLAESDHGTVAWKLVHGRVGGGEAGSKASDSSHLAERRLAEERDPRDVGEPGADIHPDVPDVVDRKAWVAKGEPPHGGLVPTEPHDANGEPQVACADREGAEHLQGQASKVRRSMLFEIFRRK